MKDFSEIKVGDWVQFTRSAPSNLKMQAGGGEVIAFKELPSFPGRGELPRIKTIDQKEHYALDPSWLTFNLDRRTRAARKATKRA